MARCVSICWISTIKEIAPLPLASGEGSGSAPTPVHLPQRNPNRSARHPIRLKHQESRETVVDRIIKRVVSVRIESNRRDRQSRTMFIVKRHPKSDRMVLRIIETEG